MLERSLAQLALYRCVCCSLFVWKVDTGLDNTEVYGVFEWSECVLMCVCVCVGVFPFHIVGI
jgi:hypothetical protein